MVELMEQSCKNGSGAVPNIPSEFESQGTHSLFVVSAAATREKNSLICPASKTQVYARLISRSYGGFGGFLDLREKMFFLS
jgi:hypothetical protein